MDGFPEKMRQVKDRHEIEAMEKSAEMISFILDKVISSLKAGRSEKDVAWQIRSMAQQMGADGLAFPSIVASGPNSSLPHAVPTDRRIDEGEPVTIDAGVRLDGYCSDITRTVFIGEPDPKLQNIYSTVRKAQKAALGEIRAGVESTHPDSVARKVISDAGYGDLFGHSLGHGVGLATHEGPRLSPLKPVKLEAGMAVTVEPGIYIPGLGGVRLEETVIVEQDGCRIITRSNYIYDF